MIDQNGSKVIINEFIRYRFDEFDLARLNKVRNHFKVLYISDITEGYGTRIKISIFNGVQDLLQQENMDGDKKNLMKKIIRYRKLQ